MLTRDRRVPALKNGPKHFSHSWNFKVVKISKTANLPQIYQYMVATFELKRIACIACS